MIGLVANHQSHIVHGAAVALEDFATGFVHLAGSIFEDLAAILVE